MGRRGYYSTRVYCLVTSAVRIQNPVIKISRRRILIVPSLFAYYASAFLLLVVKLCTAEPMYIYYTRGVIYLYTRERYVVFLGSCVAYHSGKYVFRTKPENENPSASVVVGIYNNSNNNSNIIYVTVYYYIRTIVQYAACNNMKNNNNITILTRSVWYKRHCLPTNCVHISLACIHIYYISVAAYRCDLRGGVVCA